MSWERLSMAIPTPPKLCVTMLRGLLAIEISMSDGHLIPQDSTVFCPIMSLRDMIDVEGRAKTVDFWGPRTIITRPVDLGGGGS